MKQVLIALALASASLVLPTPAHAQQISVAAQNQIRVKFINATRSYEAGNFTDALARLEEIEDLAGGTRIATAQGLKVKALVELDRWDAAREELNILYNSAPSDGVLMDIAPFAGRVDQHFAAIAERERQAALARQREDEAWQSAQATDSEASYSAYLESYPEGRYAAAAQGRFDDLQAARIAAAEEQSRLEAIATAPTYVREGYARFQRELAALNSKTEAFDQAISAPQFQIAGPIDATNFPELVDKVRQINIRLQRSLDRQVCRDRLRTINWPTEPFCEGSYEDRIGALSAFVDQLNPLIAEYQAMKGAAFAMMSNLTIVNLRCEEVANEPVYEEIASVCADIAAVLDGN